MAERTYLYVSHADNHQVSVLSFNSATGRMEELQRLPLPGIAMPMALSPDPQSASGRLLHVAIRSEPWSIASFRIDYADGRLHPIGIAPAADNFAYIATDRTGRFLLGASFTGSCLAIATIGPDGLVQGQGVQRVATAAAAHCVLPDPGNRYLLVPCRDGNCVLRLPFDAVGGRVDATAVVRLEQHPGAGPRHVAFHPSLDSVYLLNESDGSLVVYPPISSIQAPVQVCDARLPGLIGPAAAADIHLTPDGRFLYTSVRASNTIAGFAVEPASGRLIHVGHWPTETHPRGLVISPCGQWLVAAGLMSHGLSVHAIDQTTGALALRHRVESPGGPNWMAFITSA